MKLSENRLNEELQKLRKKQENLTKEIMKKNWLSLQTQEMQDLFKTLGLNENDFKNAAED